MNAFAPYELTHFAPADHGRGPQVASPGGRVSTLEQHIALLEIGRSIALCQNLERLFADLAKHLSRVMAFDYLNLVLHDPARHVMRMRVLTCRETAPDLVGMETPVGQSPAGLVWETQTPLVIDELAEERRFPEIARLLQENGVRSACILPLTTAHRRLGAIGVGSTLPSAYARGDVEFLQLAAALVAVAVDNALNHDEARLLEVQLTRERDRLWSLLDLSTAAASTLELDELLRTIAARLRRLMQCDCAGVLLPEGEAGSLRLLGLDFPGGREVREGMAIPLEGSPSGTAFRTMLPQILGAEEIARLDGAQDPGAREGLRTAVLWPLVSRNRSIGVLHLGWQAEHAPSAGDLGFLSDMARQVAMAVENAIHYRDLNESRRRLAVEKLYLEEEIRSEHNFEEIVGSSPALLRVLHEIRTVAPTDSTVLIQGETGTGKEVIARAIHNLSARKDRTFVKLNCAAIPTGLLESELFGHEKGAFTGAIAQKLGRFELADKGTLFLDEIGDIPPELQPKLLRVLQEQEFERLGSTRTQKVSVRVIAATNQDLAKAVAARQFRSDLYYRLNVFPIQLPPLRERVEDIEPLTRHFVQKHARQLRKRIASISQRSMDALLAYRWPGNVRELEHTIERAVIMTRGTELEPPLPETASAGAAVRRPAVTLREAERETILRALEAAGWVVGGPKGAAARLGLERTTLQYKMQKLGLVRAKRANV